MLPEALALGVLFPLRVHGEEEDGPGWEKGFSPVH